MAAASQQLPEGRYGRTADQRADRKLKIIGSVLGVALLGVVGWIGYDYVGGQSVSAEVIKFKVVSAKAVEVHLEVRKDSGETGVCTLRALETGGDEVGRKDVRFEQKKSRIDELITVQTTERATAVDLVGCKSV
ncbi:DUF4307 domain-containing protein [Streptomyces sp. YS-3]|uniref:DUF4307 domain-containing protein n=1 Tax=Streptomyces sp. YS-3 TaxID=3381352 RepID=UPI003862A087